MRIRQRLRAERRSSAGSGASVARPDQVVSAAAAPDAGANQRRIAWAVSPRGSTADADHGQAPASAAELDHRLVDPLPSTGTRRRGARQEGNCVRAHAQRRRSRTAARVLVQVEGRDRPRGERLRHVAAEEAGRRWRQRGARDTAAPRGVWPGSSRISSTAATGTSRVSASPAVSQRCGRHRRAPPPVRRGAGEQRLLAGQRLAGGRGDLDLDQLARRAEAGEVDDLVVARAARAAGSGRARAGPRRAPRACARRTAGRARGRGAGRPRPAAPSARPSTSCGDLVGQRRRLGPAARREDERERAVVADLLGDLERLLEVRLGLARESRR